MMQSKEHGYIVEGQAISSQSEKLKPIVKRLAGISNLLTNAAVTTTRLY